MFRLDLRYARESPPRLPLMGQNASRIIPAEYLYWEFQGRQAVPMGRWKAYRTASSGDVELYDLTTDPPEERDVRMDNPDVVTRILAIMEEARAEPELFPLPGDRG